MENDVKVDNVVKSKATKERDVLGDIIKGFLIICVLFGHSISMILRALDSSWDQSIIALLFFCWL